MPEDLYEGSDTFEKEDINTLFNIFRDICIAHGSIFFVCQKRDS